MRHLLLTPVLLLLVSCNSQHVFHSRTGTEFKMHRMAGDRGGFYYDSKHRDTILPFNMDDFRNRRDSGAYTIQYITGKDVTALRKMYPKLTVVPWNPGCPAETPKVNFSKTMDSLGSPVLLISLSYNFEVIKYRFRKAGFTNRSIYIYHAATKAGEEIVVKHVRLIKRLCPSCYAELQDEVMDINALIFEGDEVRMIFNKDSLITR